MPWRSWPGIAGVDPNVSTIGSATWARYLVDFGIAHEIDAREMPATWRSGYFGIGARDPDSKPKFEYRTEVFRLDEKLLQKALKLSANAPLADSDKARAYRASYPQPSARARPSVLSATPQPVTPTGTAITWARRPRAGFRW